MLCSASDLCLFFGTKIFPLNAPLRFHNKVEFIEAIILNDDGPVWSVTAERSRNLKPVRQFSVHLYAFIVFKLFRKTRFHSTVIDYLVIDKAMALKHISFKVSSKFLRVKEFLGIELRVAQFCVFDSIHNEELHGGTD